MELAQAARSLAARRVGAMAQVAWNPAPFRVRHAVDADGFPLLLCRIDGDLDLAMRRPEGDDVAVVLRVGGCDGRVWISGWAQRLDGLALRAAALEFASANPLSDLLDVGRGFVLYRVEVAEVRLERGADLLEVDLDAYSSASGAVSMLFE